MARDIAAQLTSETLFLLELAKKDRDYTAFTIQYGRFERRVLPQGMINSSRLYSKETLKVFQYIPETRLINYIDDTMIHNGAFFQQFNILQEMCDTIETRKIVFKIEMSHNQMKSLGHIISKYI